MRRTRLNFGTAAEELLAELTDAAYRVALKHQFKGSFIDVQLDLWSALREVIGKEVLIQERGPASGLLPTAFRFLPGGERGVAPGQGAENEGAA